MQPKVIAALIGGVFAVGGCATQDQLRQTEVQSAEQGQALRALSTGADRNEAAIAELRGEIKRTQDSMHGMELALTDARARSDAARVQAENALATSREFLSNLVAAREEQRRQLSENEAVFADLRRRLTEIESRLQAQQRQLEQGGIAFNDASRRLAAVEAALVEAGRKSTSLEARAKTAQEADASLSQQLATLRAQVEETRSVISSEGLLRMMRELEGVQRDAAGLRGSIEELQKTEADSTTRSRNFYLDLDNRLRLLQQRIEEQIAKQLEQRQLEQQQLEQRQTEQQQLQRQMEQKILEQAGQVHKLEEQLRQQSARPEGSAAAPPAAPEQ